MVAIYRSGSATIYTYGGLKDKVFFHQQTCYSHAGMPYYMCVNSGYLIYLSIDYRTTSVNGIGNR